MKPIRLVLVDDHQLVRAGLRALLDAQPDMMVVGEGSSGAEALDLAVRLRPDVVLLDIGMPDISGIQALVAIRDAAPGPKVIMLSMYSGAEYVRQAIDQGAAGYVEKNAAPDKLVQAIRAVVGDEAALAPPMPTAKPYAAGGANVGPALSRRQIQVLALMAQGHGRKEIAAMLSISVKTVETHRAGIMARLGIHDLPGLTRFAVRAGIVEP